MHLGFISQAESYQSTGRLTEKRDLEPSFESLTELICDNFIIQNQPKRTKRDRFGNETISLECHLDPGDVALFLSQLSKKGRWRYHEALQSKLILKLEAQPIDLFPKFFMPMLVALTKLLKTQLNNLNRYENLFLAILRIYRTRYIQPKPSGGDWACSPQGCRSSFCTDCTKLDRFLRDPSRQIEKFAVSNNRRHSYTHNSIIQSILTIPIVLPIRRRLRSRRPRVRLIAYFRSGKRGLRKAKSH